MFKFMSTSLSVLGVLSMILLFPSRHGPLGAPAAGVGSKAIRSARIAEKRAGARALRNRYRDQHDYMLYSGPGGGPRPPLAPETNSSLSGRRVYVPMIFPIIGGVHSMHNGFNESRGSYRHTAIDISAPKMRPVVAPFSGLLGFKPQTFWIFGDNRYKCLGTHLNDDTPGTNDNRARSDFMFAPNLRPGDRVVAGQLIGYVGNSGNATGPHLHFELFAPDGVLVNPFPSLSGAARISAPRPVLSDRAGRPEPGETRIDGCFRKWDPGHRTLTLLLVTRQTWGRAAAAYTTPTWYRLILPPEIIESAGDSETLRILPRDRPATFYVAAPPSVNGKPGPMSTSGIARRLILPVVGTVVAASSPAGSRRIAAAPSLVEPDPADPEPATSDVEFADFENGAYNGWALEGNCWGDGPTSSAAFGDRIRGYHGERYLCSFHPKLGGAATGTATSRDFTIEHPYINFLIGGGNLPGDACMNLVVDNRVVRTTSGNNRRTLVPASWDVRSLIGKQAFIKIVDRSQVPDIGYIMVDEITFSSRGL